MSTDAPPMGPFVTRLFEIIETNNEYRYRAAVDPRAFVLDANPPPHLHERWRWPDVREGELTPTSIGRLLEFTHDREAFDRKVAAHGRVTYTVSTTYTGPARELQDIVRDARRRNEDYPSRGSWEDKSHLRKVWQLLACFQFTTSELEYIIGLVTISQGRPDPILRPGTTEDVPAVSRIGYRHLGNRQSDPDDMRYRIKHGLEALVVCVDPVTNVLVGYVRWFALNASGVSMIVDEGIDGAPAFLEAGHVANIQYRDSPQGPVLEASPAMKALYLAMAVGETNVARKAVMRHMGRVGQSRLVFTKPSTSAGYRAVDKPDNGFTPVDRGAGKKPAIWRRDAAPLLEAP